VGLGAFGAFASQSLSNFR